MRNREARSPRAHRKTRWAQKLLIAAGAMLVAAFAAATAASLVMAGRAMPNTTNSAKQETEEQGGAELSNPIDWSYWLGVNDDIAAWVCIPGTGIDYPVVRAPRHDPRYYLDHDVYGGWNLFGCPYLDAGCERGMESLNSVIVGHNISFPPAMFHDLEHYAYPDFAREHLTAYVYTPTRTLPMRVVGVKTIAGWEPLKRVSFDGPEDFARYRDDLLKSCDELYADRRDYDRLVTLCSCSYYFNPDDERTLVFLTDDEAA